MLLRIIWALLLSCIFTTAFAAKASSPVSGSVFIESTDNVGNANNDADSREDRLVELNLGYDLYQKLFGRYLVSGNIGIKTVQYTDYYHLDNTDIAVTAGVLYKRENTFTAPRYSVLLSLGALNVDANNRDASYSRLTASYAKNVTDRIRLETGLEVYSQSADDSAVFDIDRQRLYVNMDYRLSRKQVLYFTPSFMHGDVTSETGLPLKTLSQASAAYNKHGHTLAVETSAEGFALSRFDADTTILNVGYNISLGRSMSLDIAYRAIDAESDGVTYRVNKWSAGILSRF